MANGRELPRGAEFRKEWERLDRTARRRVRRAATRGQPADNKREAALAAAMAVNQQRMWSWAWIVAPIIVALLRFPDGWLVMLANFLVGLLVFGLMGWFFHRRSARAERVNREVLAGKASKPRPDKGGSDKAGGGKGGSSRASSRKGGSPKSKSKSKSKAKSKGKGKGAKG